MEIIGIYKIENTHNGKVYIGSSTNVHQRKRQHFNELKNNRHCNKHLQASWNQYGEQVFKFSIIEIADKSELLVKEKIWVEKLNAFNKKFGYNIYPIIPYDIKSRHIGIRCSIKTEIKKGQHLSPATEFKKGQKHSKEWIESQRLKMIGRIVSDETRKKLGLIHKGKPLSEEHKQKLRSAHIGRKFSEEHKKNLSLSQMGRVSWNKGLKCSEETKRKISIKVSGINNPMSKENIQKRRLFYGSSP